MEKLITIGIRIAIGRGIVVGKMTSSVKVSFTSKAGAKVKMPKGKITKPVKIKWEEVKE